MSDQDDRRGAAQDAAIPLPGARAPQGDAIPLPGPASPSGAEPFRPQETELLPKLRRSAAPAAELLLHGQPPPSWDSGELPRTEDPVHQAIALAAEEPTAFDLDVLELGAPAGEETQDEVPLPAPPASDPFPMSDATELHGAGWQPSVDDLGDAFDRALSGPFPAPPAPPPLPTGMGTPAPGALGMPEVSFPAAEVPATGGPAAFPSAAPMAGGTGVPPSEPLGLDAAIAEESPGRSRFVGIAAWLGGLLVLSVGALVGLHFTGLVSLPGLGAAEAPAIAAVPEEAPPSAAPASEGPSEAPATNAPEIGEQGVAAAPASATPGQEAVAVVADTEDGPEVDLERLEEAPGEADGDVAGDEVAPAEPVISPKWKKKVVYVGLARARDQSESGVSRLERSLKDGFSRALKQDEHARWRVLSRRVSRGHVVHLDVTEVALEEPEGGLRVKVTCQASAWAKPGRSEKVVTEARAQASVEGRPNALLRAQLTRDATRTCAYSLSQGFVLAALQ